MGRGRPTARWAVAPALACGVLVAILSAAPGGAQDPPPTSTPPTTAGPPTTEQAVPGTSTSSTTETTLDPATTATTGTTAATGTGTPPPSAEATPEGEATTTTTVPAPPVDPPSAAAAGPSLRLDLAPGALLVDGQAVGASISGLTGGDYPSVQQCVAGTEPAWQRCAWDGADVVAGPDGTAGTTLHVDAVLAVGNEFEGSARRVDCRVEACVARLEVEGGDVGGGAVEVPLPFDPDGPLAPPPTATVAPAGPYRHGQPVTVRADGLVWSSAATVALCAAGTTGTEGCDQGLDGSYGPVADGHAEIATTLYAVIDTADGPVDCRAADACELVVTSAYDLRAPEKSARVPLAFDPTTEVVPPTLAVSPADGLVHGQVLTATGQGFAGGYVQFSECADPSRPETCTWLDAFAPVGAGGTFTVEVSVTAVLPTPDGEVDCRASADPCVLVASPSGPDSSRAGRVALRFDPDAPLPPPPTIALTPATDLADEATVTVAGAGFGALGTGRQADVQVCRSGSSSCDEAAGRWVEVAPDGTFTTDIGVAARFTAWDGTEVDCRTAPGCEVTATDGYQGRTARAPLAFGPPPTMDDRYRAAVFDDVDVTRDVVYRTTTDASGATVQLTLDVHAPAGDTVDQRPVVVWLSDGWFRPGQSAPLTGYADAFARRGYVSVTMDHRARPGLVCCPTDDIEGVTAAAADVTDDAAAGVRWLRAHADELGIDPDAIVVGGSEAGAVAAFGLAHVVDAPIAAAVPLGGVGFGRPGAGDPPFLAFHGGSNLAPAHLSQWACARARALGTTCDTVTDADAYDVAAERQRSIVPRASDWLADVVLAPRGYVEPSARPGGVDGWIQPLPAVLATAAPLDAGVVAAVRGTLPVTGASTSGLVVVGLALCVVGGAALAARRAGVRRLTDAGDARLVVVAVVGAVALVVAGFGITSALGPDDDDAASSRGPAAGGEADAATSDDVDHDAMDHDAMDHDAMDHDALGHASTAHDGHGTGAATATGHGGHGAGSSGGGGHAHASGTAAGGHTDGHVDGHAGSGTDGHVDGHPTVPGEPPHEHPGDPTDPHDPHGPEQPPTGFDPSWTPEQVAFAQQLIADTQAQLVRYDNLAILPLTGYQWIRDGQQVDTYQHWIHLSRIVDGHRLDAAFPESLVLRTTPDGPVLEASMYMLSLGYTLANIPADIAWLPDWHVHDNLCFEPGYVLVGVTVDGRCERGSVVVTPPMVHVWREPTRCGWFAGVDEFGLQCHGH